MPNFTPKSYRSKFAKVSSNQTFLHCIIMGNLKHLLKLVYKMNIVTSTIHCLRAQMVTHLMWINWYTYYNYKYCLQYQTFCRLINFPRKVIFDIKFLWIAFFNDKIYLYISKATSPQNFRIYSKPKSLTSPWKPQ